MIYLMHALGFIVVSVSAIYLWFPLAFDAAALSSDNTTWFFFHVALAVFFNLSILVLLKTKLLSPVFNFCSGAVSALIFFLALNLFVFGLFGLLLLWVAHLMTMLIVLLPDAFMTRRLEQFGRG